MRTAILLTVAAALCAAPAIARPLEDRTIEQLSLGEYWYGPEITKDDLKGKVVLVELWGS